VISSKVKDRSLLARDFRRGQLPRGTPGPQGPRGLQGVQGAKGDKGDKGDPTYRRTVVVSPVGGTTPADWVQNGTKLRNAIAAIADASSLNRYLVEIEPGTYDIGTTSLVLKPNVHLEGAGIQETVVIGNVSSTTSGAVTAAPFSSLRWLMVYNAGHAGSYAIWDVSASNFTIDHVMAQAEGSPTRNVALGLRNSNPSVVSSTLVADDGIAYGIEAEVGSHPSIDYSYAEGSGAVAGSGLLQDGASAVARWSQLTGSTYGAVVIGNGALKIAASEVKSVNVSSGSAQCVASFKENWTPLTVTCG
jgi:hypothetical protein